MQNKRIIVYLMAFGLVIAPWHDALAKRQSDTYNSKLNYTQGFLAVAGSIITAGVFHVFYSILSKQQPRKQKLYLFSEGRSLLVSGNYGKRLFIAGEDAGTLTSGGALGVSVRYKWRANNQGLSYFGLLYRTAEHDGKGRNEGYTYKMSKIGFMVGNYKKSYKATWEWDIGAGIVVSQYSYQGVSSSGRALMLWNSGSGFGIRISDRFIIGPRVEWSTWSYISSVSLDYYGQITDIKWSDLFSIEVLLQTTINLF